MPAHAAPVVCSNNSLLRRILHADVPDVWSRFLIAVTGLVLAFGAALFSTVSRDSGNLWATLILASSALVLAAVVGVMTVPFLLRRAMAERTRSAAHYRVTRIGVLYVLGGLVIGIAGLRTGNNLLYIVSSSMMAAVIVSGVAATIVLRKLRLDIRLPEHVFAGRPVKGRIILRNPRRHLPAFSIRVRPSGAPGKPSVKQSLSSQGTARPGKDLVARPRRAASLFEGSAYYPFVKAQSEEVADIELEFSRRGLYREEGFTLATRFPFALLAKSCRIALAREIIAYPQTEPPDSFFEVLPLITGEFDSFVRGRGHDLYRIREYMPEDSARHVDWKATAKSGRLLVREFSREDERKLRIVFDNPEPGVLSAAQYEHAVQLAASLSWHFAGLDNRIQFVAQGFSGSGIYQFLRYLALVAPEAGDPLLDRLPASDDYNLVVTARGRDQIPSRLWNSSYILLMGAPWPGQHRPA